MTTTTTNNGTPPTTQETAALIKAADTNGGAINAFSNQQSFESAQRMAKALASSTLVPQAYQNNLPNVLIAMELASRIGASVFAIMQNIDIIHGRPSWRATFLIATVNASGRFTPLRFRWQGTEGKTDWGCRAVAKDRETGEECVGALITVNMANVEGWATKNGSKWKTMPEQMLMYRAAAFWTRVYAPELSLGMHTSEEVIDAEGIDITNVQPLATSEPSALETALLAKGSATEPGSAPNAVAAPDSAPAAKAEEPKKGRAAKQQTLVDEETGEVREPGEEG